MVRRKVQRKERNSIKMENHMNTKRRNLKILMWLLVLIIKRSHISRMTLMRRTVTKKNHTRVMERIRLITLYTLSTRIRTASCTRRKWERILNHGSLKERALLLEVIRKHLPRMLLLLRNQNHQLKMVLVKIKWLKLEV